MNRQIVLARTPDGAPVPDDFAVRDAPIPQPGPGEVLIQTEWLSLDPYMRAQMAGRHMSGTAAAGAVLSGETVGVVMAGDGWDVGTRVRGMGGWQTHAALPSGEVTPVSDAIPEPRWALSALGMPGLTAWAAITQYADVQPGETVVIPAASGAVGAVAAGLARARGAHVVGIVGSSAKVDYVLETLRLDGAIDRRAEDVGERLDALCPDSIDVFLDLVGGPISQAAFARLAVGARAVLIGLMADYNRPDGVPPTAIDPGHLIRARATARGLVVYDHFPQRETFLAEVAPLVASGAVPFKEEIVDGLEAAPAAFCRLMAGETFGKVLVEVISKSEVGREKAEVPDLVRPFSP